MLSAFCKSGVPGNQSYRFCSRCIISHHVAVPPPLSGPWPFHYRSFTITPRHTPTILGRTPLYEWSARRRDLYLTTHNTHNRRPPIPLGVFEPAIPASELSKTYALDRAANGIGLNVVYRSEIVCSVPVCCVCVCDWVYEWVSGWVGSIGLAYNKIVLQTDFTACVTL